VPGERAASGCRNGGPYRGPESGICGTPIGGNDLIIAAQAVTLDLTLVSDNEREFARVVGLRVENWLKD
jgi:predicted nucleic acid-binding protein